MCLPSPYIFDISRGESEYLRMIKKMRENINTKKLVNEIIDKMYERLADELVSLIMWAIKWGIVVLLIIVLIIILALLAFFHDLIMLALHILR